MRQKTEHEKSADFAELLHVSRSRVFGFIISLVQNHADAEEVFQETALRLWQKFDEYEAGKDFGTWATKFAHLTALNYIRKSRRYRNFFSESALEQIARVHERDVAADASARTAALANCLEKLPTKDQRLIESCYAGSQTMKQLAGELGRSVDAIYKAAERTRRRLLACMKSALEGNHARK